MPAKPRKKPAVSRETDGWHRYRLHYHANRTGKAKTLEFRAENITRALEFAMDDPACRTIEIWEDEHYACRFSRDGADAPDGKPTIRTGGQAGLMLRDSPRESEVEPTVQQPVTTQVTTH